MEDKNQITFVLNVWYNYFERIIMDTKKKKMGFLKRVV